MRTTIYIDEALIAEAQRLSGQPTKKATVEEALRLLVRQRRQKEADGALYITPPAITGEGPPPRGKPVMTLRELLLELERDRADR